MVIIPNVAGTTVKIMVIVNAVLIATITMNQFYGLPLLVYSLVHGLDVMRDVFSLTIHVYLTHIYEPCGIPSRRPQSHGTIVRTKGLHRKYQPLTGNPVTCDRGGDRREIDPERAWCEFVAEFAEQRVVR